MTLFIKRLMTACTEKVRLILIVLFWVASVNALAVEVYDFPNDEARERYQDLTWELRCPKCQNQNIADSNAPIARDLRREVHRMVVEGRTDQEVIDFMVERYGDFVLYRPPMAGHTMILWLAPVVLVLVGITVVLVLGRLRQKAGQQDDELTQEEQQRLQQLLGEAESTVSSNPEKSDKP